MKARLTFWNGQWWCKRREVTGCGDSPRAAWNDMWALYREFVIQQTATYFDRIKAG